jgi:SnoaL-like domain
MRWKALVAIGLGLSLGAGVAPRAQAPTNAPAKAVVLTPADYIEIQQLAVRSSYAIDSGANGGELFADLFASDGAFISASRGRIEGHDNLVALGKGRNPMYPRRFIVNHVIEPSPDGATGRVYVLEVDLPTDGKVGGELTSTGGRYEDQYEKTPAGWRFRSRKFVPSKVEVPGAQRGAPPAPSGAQR